MTFYRQPGEKKLRPTISGKQPQSARTAHLVDRTVELRVACEKVRSPTVRLLTLVGPPALATRLSLEVGQALLADFPDGIWFVALSSLTDPALLLPTLARVLNVSDSGA